MTLPHVHLLLNHFPTVGFAVGLGIFLLAVFTRSHDLKRAGISIVFVMALLTIPAYVSGDAAREAIKGRSDVSEALVVEHRDAALPAFLFMEITGAVAFLGLWQYRRSSTPAPWTSPALVLLSLVTFALMANAANIGGHIRHPETSSAQIVAASTATGAWIETAKISAFVVGEPWVWPASETLHFIGLCLLFTTVLLVNLRMLGMAKGLSFSALHRLLPLGLLGFSINLFTGMLFFIGAPEQYTRNVAFYWKIVLMVLAGSNVLYFMLFDEPWTVGPGDDAPIRAKIIAASAMFLWFGVLFFGHMLPFIGNAF